MLRRRTNCGDAAAIGHCNRGCLDVRGYRRAGGLSRLGRTRSLDLANGIAELLPASGRPVSNCYPLPVVPRPRPGPDYLLYGAKQPNPSSLGIALCPRWGRREKTEFVKRLPKL